MANLSGDVRLVQTKNDGEITIIDGVVEMDQGFETFIYLCFFGGNEDDDGRDKNPKQWWANWEEPQSSRHYRSELQYVLTRTNPTSEGLLKIEEAAKNDLKVFLSESIASEVTVLAVIPALNRVALTVTIRAEGQEQSFKFVANWRAAI